MEARYGIYPGDPVREVREMRERQTEETWRPSSYENLRPGGIISEIPITSPDRLNMPGCPNDPVSRQDRHPQPLRRPHQNAVV